tara:strand:- start:51 stop:524 length:474 start_codon:yes stop_codon:yes gene_type:complete
MNDSKGLTIEGKVVENALDNLIKRWASTSFDVQTVVDGLLSKSIQLTFKMCSSHQDAVEMITVHMTNIMIDNHQVDNTLASNTNNEAFKVDEDVPHTKFRSAFCRELDKLEPGQSIGNLTKEQVYKYRPNFYSKHFADRKFSFKLEANGLYRIWRIR